MNAFSIAGLIFVFFPSLMLAIFILIKKRNRINIIWSLFLLAVSLWGFGMYKIGSADNPINSLFWWKVAEVGVILIPVLLTHFVIEFLCLKRKIFLFIFYIITFILLYFNIFTDFFIKKLYFSFDQFYYILATPLYTIFIVIFSLSVLYVLLELYIAYKKSSGIFRFQIKYLFWSFAVGFSGGLTSYFPVYRINVYPVWNATIFVSIVLVTYAILKYRFMDLRQVARNFIIYFIDAVFVYIFFNALVFAYTSIWGSVWSGYSMFAGIFIAPIFVLLLFYFHNLISSLVDKYFFFSLYDYRQTIIKLTAELNNYNDLNKIIDLIVDTIKRTMGLNRAGVLLADNPGANAHYKITKVVGFDVTNGISLVRDNFLTKYLKKTVKPLVRDELALLSKDSKNSKEAKAFLSLEKSMKKIEASLCLPLIKSNKLMGIIVLGAKESGDPYTNEDLNLLSILSNQAATAIDNARLYQETKNFNKLLQQKVDEQTFELKKRAEHLEKLLKMREEFLDIASHQLKTPVSVIRGTLSMFKEGSMDKLSEAEKKKFLDSAYRKSEKLHVIISDILRASELDSEEFKIDLENSKKIYLEDVLKEVYDDLKDLANEKNLKLEINLPKKKSFQVLTMADFLEQAIYNLVDNAIKYTKAGFVKLEMKVVEKDLIIKIIDSGIGIPKVDQKKLFDKFTRASNAVNMYTDGSGLGLFIAKKIIEAHNGGSLNFESEEGKGTIFTIKLRGV